MTNVQRPMTNEWAMGSEAQQIVVIVVVALAATFVLWTVIARFLSRGKSCGSACSGCSACEKALGEPKAFVGIDTLSQTQHK